MHSHASQNRAYSLVWNEALGAYVPAPEGTRRRSKRGGRAIAVAVLGSLVGAGAWAQAVGPGALPSGGTVSVGSATIGQSGSTLTVQQSTDRAAIDWQRFVVGQDARVNFQQPSAASVILNRVVGQDPTQVLGRIDANGHVFISNPNGVLFAPGSQVNAAGILATTHSISSDDFAAGRYHFSGDSTATVENQGTLNAAQGGYVALVGAQIINGGTITAPGGDVRLAAAGDVTLQVDGSHLASFTVARGVFDAAVANKGLIRADGGRVWLTASGLDQLSRALVNNTGVVEASSVDTTGGRIVLQGDFVSNTGTLAASQKTGSVTAGEISISGRSVQQAGDLHADGEGGKITVVATDGFLQTDGAHVTASGNTAGMVRIDGGQSTWLSGEVHADGANGGRVDITGATVTLAAASVSADGTGQGGAIHIGGDAHGASLAQPGDAAGNFLNATTTRVNTTSALSARGNGGTVVVWSDRTTSYAGVAATGAGGFIEISGKGDLTFQGSADPGLGGNLLLDPTNIVIGAGVPTATDYVPLVDPHPAANDQFGNGKVTALANGNIAITSPGDNFGASAAGGAYLYSRVTGSLISALFGSTANDAVGSGGVTALNNGSFVVNSPNWSSNASTAKVGAATWGSATAGVNGVINAGNSFVGQAANDQVSSGGTVALAGTTGNYVVASPLWNGGMGAVSFGLSTGGSAGTVNATTSLVGSKSTDAVGGNITALSNGNYVVDSSNWSNGSTASVGAVTWGSGTAGVRGAVGNGNSVVGSNANDQLGSGGIVEIGASNYVIDSPNSNTAATLGGAVTWANGSAATTGTVNQYNSLVGNANDQIGSAGIVKLSNGNFVAVSPNANGGAGAVTFGFNSSAYFPRSFVAANNSLTGSGPTDHVGSGGVTALPGSSGGYVVLSPTWAHGPQVGAATLGDGSGAIAGAVSTGNSLVGSAQGDFTGAAVTVLTNGNYVVDTPGWHGPAGLPTLSPVGAVTWVNGNTGLVGSISQSNALYGTSSGDAVGLGGVTALSNGNYVVDSYNWTNGGPSVFRVGAVTWGNGATGTRGAVGTANSLYGGLGDEIGSGTTARTNNLLFLGGFVPARNDGVVALTNGNYVVVSSAATLSFALGTPGGVGAITWGNGLGGTTGLVSRSNSIAGTSFNDSIGSGGVLALSGGGFLVNSPSWSSTAGAVTFGSGTAPSVFSVNATNSLVGSAAGDAVGSGNATATISNSLTPVITPATTPPEMLLSNGNYVVVSPKWSNGSTIANAGAVTFGNGTTGIVGVVGSANSLVGTHAGDGVGAAVGSQSAITALSNGNYLVDTPNWTNGSAASVGAVTWASGTTGVAGVIGSANSLVGATAGDKLGSTGVTVVGAGYVFGSATADLNGVVDTGAMILGDSTHAIGGTLGGSIAATGPVAGYFTPAQVATLASAGTTATLQASGSITVNAATTVAGTLNLFAGSALTLNAPVMSTATGTAMNLVDATFVNNYGANALLAPNGRWIVWSYSPANDFRNGLAYSFKDYGAAYFSGSNGSLPNGAPATGNGFAYYIAPTVNLSLTGAIGKTYDGTTTANATGANVSASGLIDGDVFNDTAGSSTYANANAGSNKNVTLNLSQTSVTNGGVRVYGVNVVGGGAAASGAIGTITPASVTVSASAQGKTYDGTTTATIAGNTIGGLVGNETLNVTNTGAYFDTKNVGTQKLVTESGLALVNGTGLASNYALSSTIATTVASVTPKTLAVIGQNATKTYDGTTVMTGGPGYTTAGTVAAGAGSASDGKAIASDDLSLVGATAFANPNAGGSAVLQNTVALKGADAANYTLGYVAGSGTINKAPLTITANDSAKVLTQADPTLTLRYSGFVDGETASVLNGASATRATGEGAGTYAITANATAANYTITKVNGTFTVQPANTLLITNSNASVIYGDGVASLVAPTAVYYSSSAGALRSLSVGQIAGNTWGASDGYGGTVTFTFGASANATSSVGNYAITTGNFQSTGLPNFSSVAFTSGTLTVAPRGVSASVLAAPTKVYDGNTAIGSVSLGLSNLVNGDAVGVQGTAAFASRNASTNATYSISDMSLAGSAAPNYFLTANSLTATNGSITPRHVVAAGTSYSGKTYDATTGIVGGSYTFDPTQVVIGDSVAVTGAAVYDSANAGNRAVLRGSLALAGGTASNYVLDYIAGSGIIAQKMVVAYGFGGVTRTYDGTTTVPTGGYFFNTNQIILGDVASLTGAAVFDSRNAGSRSIVRGTLGLSNTNYALNFVNGWGTINQATLGYGGLTVASKVYDGTRSASISGNGGFTGVVAGDQVVTNLANASAVFDTRNVGTSKTVTVSQIGLSGNDAGNYVFSGTTTATAAVTAKAITVSASGVDKVYDGTTSGNALLGSAGVIAGDQVGFTGSATFGDKNVASAKTVSVAGIAATGADSGNYALAATTAQTTASIVAKPISVSAIGADKVYDGGTATTATLSSAGVISGDTVSFAGTAAFADKNAGTGKTVNVTGITDSGADAGNYVLTGTATATTATIAQKLLTVSATAANKVYDGSTGDTATVAAGGVVAGDSVNLSGTALFFDKNAGVAKQVAVGNIVASGADAANYSLSTTLVGATADITQRALGVAASASNKTYDGTTSASASLSGLNMVQGDDLNLAGTATFADKNAAAGKTVTVSGITKTGADANNYSLQTPVAQTSASILARTIAVTASVANKVYDGTTRAVAQLGSSGVIAGDSVAISGTAAFTDKNAGQGKTVNVAGIALSGGDAANYALASGNAATSAAISALTLSVAATAQGKTYDGTTSATAQLTGVGVIAGDNLGLTGNASFSDKNAGTGKTVTVANISETGTDARNYVLSSTSATARADIAAKAVTVTATASGKVYDGTAAATAVLAASGILRGDSVGFSGSAAFTDKNAATGKTVNVSQLATTGTDAGNYVLANASATAKADITARSIAVTASGIDKTYDATTAATVNYAAAGIVSGDVVNLGGTANFTDKNAAAYKLVNVTGISTSGTDAVNYALSNTSTSTTASILQKTITVAAKVADRTYDGTTTAQASMSGVGVIAGDVVNVSGSASFADKNAGANKLVNVTVGGAATITGSTVSLNGGSFFGGSSTTIASGGTTVNSGLSGADAQNYRLGSPTTTSTATILQRTVSVAARALDKVYDGTTAATAKVVADGVLAGDSVAFAGTASFAGKNAGFNKAVSVTGIAATGTDSGNYALRSTTASTVASITPKTIAVTAAASDKTYDGTTSANASLTSADLIRGDVVTLAGLATFADKNAGSAKTVNVTGIAETGADAGNYLLATTTATTSASIAQKAIGVIATASDKVYDGTTAATAQLAGDGVVKGDLVTLAGSASFADKNAGAAKAVGVTNIVASGTDAGNYTLTGVVASTTAGITPKSIAVQATSAADKVYDGTTSAQATLASDGLVRGDSVSFAGQAAFDDKNAGAKKLVTVSQLVAGGADAGNYAISTATATTTAAITPKTIGVSGADATKTYDGTTTLLGTQGIVAAGTVAAGAGSATDGKSIAGDDLGYTGAAGFASANAGSVAVVQNSVKLKGADAGNYAIAWSNGSGTIGKASLTVTANDDAKVLTQVDPTLTAHYSGFVNGESASALSSVAVMRAAGESAGTYAITASATAANYAITTVGGTFTVTPADTLLIKVRGAAQVYGDTTPGFAPASATYFSSAAGALRSLALTSTGNGTWSGSDGLGGGVSFKVASAAATGVGNYAINVTNLQSTGASNFAGFKTTTGFLTVTQRALTASMQGSPTKAYDGTTSIDALSLALANRVGSDDVSVAGTAAFANRNAGTSLAYGVTDLTLAGTTAANYYLSSRTLSGSNGTITPKTVTVAGNSGIGKVYDRTTTVTNGYRFDASQIVAGDTTALSGAVAYDSKNAGTRSIVQGTLGIDDPNYRLAYTAGSGTIAQAAVSVVGVVASDKVYDGTTSASITGSGSLKGVIVGDSVSGNLQSATASFGDKNVGAGKAVDITGLTISGADASNYRLVGDVATTASITPKTLAVSARASDKVYDGGTGASATLASDGVIGGDAIAFSGSAAFADKNVAVGKVVTVSGIEASGSDAGNYRLGTTTATTTATITPKTVTVVASASDKVYDGSIMASATLTGNGVLAGDSVALTGNASFADKNAGVAKTVNVTGIAENGADAGNYVLGSTSTATTASITPKTINIVATAADRVYDGTTLATAMLSADGIVQGDSVAFAGSANFGNKNVGQAKAVTIAGIVDSGADAGNYLLASATATTTAAITPKTITLAATAADKVYDGTTAANALIAATGVVSGDQVAFDGTAAFADKNAGRGKAVSVGGIFASGVDAGNYAFASNSTTTTASIATKTVSASATAVDKVYDGTSAAQAVVGGTGVIAGDNVAFSGQASFDNKNAGMKKTVEVDGITMTGGDAANYVLAGNSTTTSAAITPKTINVSGTDATKTYDGTTAMVGTQGIVAAGTVAAGAGASTDGKVIAGDDLGYYGAAGFASANAGNVAVVQNTLQLKGADAGNYAVNWTNGNGIIGKAALTVIANDDAKVLTQADPTLTARYSGFVNGENALQLGNVSVTRAAGESAGSYAISASATAANYTVTSVAGTFIVQPADTLLVRVDNASKVYGDALGGFAPTSAVYYSSANAALQTLTLSSLGNGLWGGNDGLGGSLSFRVGTTASANSSVGNYAIGVSDLQTAGASNFAGIATRSGYLTVTPRAVNAVVATGPSKVYDGSTSIVSIGLGVANGVSGDDLTVSGSGSYDSRNAGTGMGYGVQDLTLGGASAGNYFLASRAVTGNDGVITPKTVNAFGGTGIDKVYDRTTTAASNGLRFDSTQIVAGDASALSGSVAYDSRNAGVRSIVQNTLALDDANYRLVYTPGSGTIAQAKVSVTGVTAADKTYDGTTGARVTGNGALQGVIAGDVVTSNTEAAQAAFADPNAGTGKMVTVGGITLSGADAGNYVLAPSLAATTASITPRPITVSLTGSVDKQADGSTTATLGTSNFLLAGLVTGESLFVGATGGRYDSASVGSGKDISVAVGSADYLAGDGTLASNYQLVTGTLSGAIGTITPAPAAPPATVPVGAPVAAKTTPNLDAAITSLPGLPSGASVVRGFAVATNPAATVDPVADDSDTSATSESRAAKPVVETIRTTAGTTTRVVRIKGTGMRLPDGLKEEQ